MGGCLFGCAYGSPQGVLLSGELRHRLAMLALRAFQMLLQRFDLLASVIDLLMCTIFQAAHLVERGRSLAA